MSAGSSHTTDLLMKGSPDDRTTHAHVHRGWGELLDTLRDLDSAFLEGAAPFSDDRHIADGYRALATTLGVALDTYLFAEPSRPIFLELNTPYRRDRRWGGDNTDAYYRIAPVSTRAPLPDLGATAATPSTSR